ncbi:hypothetical protein [Ruminococcus flavefaciens]|uniref:Uncharacterized protein n=1 Tax=Ruminococcus flavefaciens TaxID=1265 RepID=A0A1M7JMP9_RUMFL|nr:hypothetical protein [Ruminococcus flavefaciens]SHM54023.1 hypothetical protein SAMN04487860_10693 [Ruminococcus flavefaciens]
MKTKKVKFIKLAAAFAVIALSVLFWFIANKLYSENYIENLEENCTGISDLSNYIDYNMLSSDMKKYISERDFKFSTDEEKYEFCNKYRSLNYIYDARGNWKNIYPTDKMGNLFDILKEDITVNGTTYTIYVSLIFKTRPFLTTQIVDLDTGITVKQA